MNTRSLAAAILALAASGPACADDWNWSVTPYLWATDVGVDVDFADRELVNVTVPFEDLLEDLDTVTQIRAEAMRGAHGISLDLFNVELADDDDRMPLPGGMNGDLELDTQTGMTILDVAGVYDPQGDGSGISLLYGIRTINQRNTIDARLNIEGQEFATASYETDDSFVDGLIGLRYAGSLTGRWSYELAADFSTGGTDHTWSVAPAIGYTFGDNDQYRLTAGYRHMVVDFDTHEPTDMDMSLSGALVGFSFSF